MSALSKLGIFTSLVLISAVTLYPFNFTLERIDLSWKILTLSPGTEIDREIVANSLLYAPLGFGIPAYFRSQGMTKVKLLTLTLVICFALSYSFEVLQSFLPSRYPSWRDVGSNTLGGILGCLCMLVWETKNTQRYQK